MDGILEKGTEPAGLSERPQEAGGDKSAGGPPAQRFSAKRKLRACWLLPAIIAKAIAADLEAGVGIRKIARTRRMVGYVPKCGADPSSRGVRSGPGGIFHYPGIESSGIGAADRAEGPSR
jgi:hypothetical protein